GNTAASAPDLSGAVTSQGHNLVGDGTGITALITDLGGGQAYGINSSGQVVGQNAAGHAFLYGNGTMTNLGTLGGTVSNAISINDRGQVVGWSATGGFQPNSTIPTTNAFLYSNGTMVGLGPAGAIIGGASGINAAGQGGASGINAAGQVTRPGRPTC